MTLGPPPGAPRVRHNGFAGTLTRAVRSSHCGFDCYCVSKTNSGTGRVRILARTTRLPPHLDEELRYRIPEEMHWPEPDHTMAHRLIDAVLTLNVTKLAEWRAYWPGHQFGFEQFQAWAEDRVARASDDPSRYAKEQAPIEDAMRRFPIDRISRVVKLGSTRLDTHAVVLSYVYFANGDEAVRLSVYGFPAQDEHLLLSRAYIDVVDNRYDITEHFPGRYDALGLPHYLINDLLGVERFKVERRVSRAAKARILGVEEAEAPTPNGQEGPAATTDWRERRPHSRRVTEHARQVQAAILGDPDRPMAHRPAQAPPPAPAQVPSRPDPDHFPTVEEQKARRGQAALGG